MTKKQVYDIAAVIAAMYEHNKAEALDESVPQRIRDNCMGGASALSSVMMMLQDPKYVSTLAKIYDVAL